MSRVTVLVPNYNGAAYLRQCLKSVQAQTFSDWTLVVGDNASTDESVAIVAQVADPRIRLVRRPRTIGWVANVNLLLAEAVRSEYVAVLHSDDWWDAGFLTTTVGMLDASPGSLFATTAVRLLRGAETEAVSGLHRFLPAAPGATRTSIDTIRVLTGGCCIFTPGVLARATLYGRVGGYEETLPQACDWLMWLRAAAAGTVAVSSLPLATYRMHDASLTAQIGRANLRGIDLVRLLQLVRVDWRECEPYHGAIHALASTVTIELLANAAQRAELGDRQGALLTARLARAVAPSLRQAVLSAFVTGLLHVTSYRSVRSAQVGLLRVGRVAWHRAHRQPDSEAA